MTVGALLERLAQQLAICRPEDTIQTVATVLAAKGVDAFPVCDETGRMTGIISERDLVPAFAHRGGAISLLRLRDIMTRKGISCSPDDTVAHARAVLHRHRIRHHPVVRGGRMIDILSIRDLLEGCLEESELEVNVLKDTVIAARFR